MLDGRNSPGGRAQQRLSGAWNIWLRVVEVLIPRASRDQKGCLVQMHGFGGALRDRMPAVLPLRSMQPLRAIEVYSVRGCSSTQGPI